MYIIIYDYNLKCLNHYFIKDRYIVHVRDSTYYNCIITFIMNNELTIFCITNYKFISL